MARLEMNFAAHRPRSRFVLVVLVVGLAGSLHALWLQGDLLDRRDAAQDEIRRLERALFQEKLSDVSRVRQDPQAVAETKRLIAELQRPWEAMLNSLQKAAKPDILIVRIQPESNANRLLISGQADNNQAFLTYVARLRKDVAWHAVEPVSEERSTTAFTQNGKPVSFQLMAEWRVE